MKNIKNNALKILVTMALLSSVAFADGEMGGGGLSDPGNESRLGKTATTITAEDGEMGGGGRTSESSFLSSMIDSVSDYFDWMV
jgi:hypothetical protein